MDLFLGILLLLFKKVKLINRFAVNRFNFYNYSQLDIKKGVTKKSNTLIYFLKNTLFFMAWLR